MPPASRTPRRTPPPERPPAETSIDASADGPASRGASVGRAYEKLRELIVWGRLAPGSRIVESEIAERLQVSRTPARSALHRLRQEGYVASLDRASEQRLIVAPLTQEDGRELFYIVGQLEGLAAHMAAELPPPARAALVRRLRQRNRELAQAARAPRSESPRIFELDAAFHQTYVEAGAGPRLLALHAAINPQAERYGRLYVNALVDEIETSVEEHDAIVRRVAAGEPAEAQQAVETNWRNAAARLARVITTLGERGNW